MCFSELLTSGFCLSVGLSVTPHILLISLLQYVQYKVRDLLEGSLLARATNFKYFENGYDESSSRVAP